MYIYICMYFLMMPLGLGTEESAHDDSGLTFISSPTDGCSPIKVRCLDLTSAKTRVRTSCKKHVSHNKNSDACGSNAIFSVTFEAKFCKKYNAWSGQLVEKNVALKSTAHLLELRFTCLDSNVSKIFHLSCAFLLSPEALTQKKMTPAWNVQVKISSVRLETETCYTHATHWVFMLCPMFAASVDGKGVTSVFARSTEFSPSEAHVRDQIWHGKTHMQWEAFHVHPWSSFCLWIAAREQLKIFKTISPWSTLYPSISPNLYPSTYPSPSIYQPLIHPLYNLYPFTHPSPSIYQPL